MTAAATHTIARRPRPLRAIDAIGRGAGRLGWRGIRFDVETVLEHARRSAKLDDFGDARFREGLEVLVDSLERDARLSPFGRYVAKRQLVEVLVHRLTLTAYRASHPEVEEQRIEKPLFVLGLPRTGTTLLHELLAQDPAHRAPLSWELDDPCPPTAAPLDEAHPRVVKCERRFSGLRAMAPDFQAIHPIGALLPQECLVATAYAFASVRFELCFDVSTYQRWLTRQDMHFAYQTHREVLQHHQSRRTPKRWVLKSPGHLSTVDVIAETYPDAMMIQTHRDPQKVIPSVASLYANMRSIATEDLRLEKLGRDMLEVWSTYLEDGIRRRRETGDAGGRIVDVHFHELVADPV
ncbi:MAG: sulfotransferase, partial [Myxococcales bacterium]|nr:sulfotransferase [Myxococcales bacterium]